ncbi:MAG TPA: hypothetical protein VKB78_03615, partial [Pirellulales bacterium]|nr:hypothetical protein [Pirellulales bacterium]
MATAEYEAALDDRPQPVDSELIEFRCNICSANVSTPRSKIRREMRSCSNCGSTLRWRSIVHALSLELFGRSLAIAEFPVRFDLKGVGLT